MKSNVLESDASRMARSTILAITTHAFIPLIWIFLALFIVPKLIGGFMESNFEIPALTAFFIKLIGFISKYWLFYLFLLLLFLVADGAVYFSLLRSSGKFPAGLWSIVVILAEGALTVLCIIVLCLPLMKIVTRME